MIDLKSLNTLLQAVVMCKHRSCTVCKEELHYTTCPISSSVLTAEVEKVIKLLKPYEDTRAIPVATDQEFLEIMFSEGETECSNA